MNRKDHWEKIYTTKQPNEVSWTQKIPQTSLDLIEQFNLPIDAKIIDSGGGDSTLVDHLLAKGYTNLTVLDISEAALQRAQKRLGTKANLARWIVSDITDFKPSESYNLWHDRAVFHFLTDAQEIVNYISNVQKAARNMVLATFSVNGPLKCSGLEITQYNTHKMTETFGRDFNLLDSFELDHFTPFGTSQNFIFTSWSKKPET